jgi:hypothetical protein
MSTPEKQTRNLLQISDIKEKIMGDLAEDENILKLLVNQGEDALSQPAPSPSEVIHVNIHPKSRSKNMLLVDQGNVTIRIAVIGDSDGYYRSYNITIFILFPETMSYVLKESRRLVREDYMAHLVDLKIDKSRGYGLGKLKFSGFLEADAPEGFDGVGLSYETMDFS